MVPSPSDPFLTSLGWNDFFQASFEDDIATPFSPGRVISQGKGHYRIQVAPQESLEASITSKFHNAIKEPLDFPAVGDWITFARGQGNQQATIQRVLKRKSIIQRRRSGAQQGVQIIATNIDYMLIVSSFNEDFDLQRLGRYVALGIESGCTTVLLMTKSDLCANPAEYIDKFKSEFADIEVFAISIMDKQSIAPLQNFFAPGKTSVLVGSSGVGKSTLSNFLLGFEAQKTQPLSTESKGRHTTTARSLLFTRWGGLVIDTPGMQEISILASEAELQNNFSDVEETTLRCKFTNCGHKSEPGCAILAAVKDGTLNPQRWEEYLKAAARNAPRQKKKKH